MNVTYDLETLGNNQATAPIVQIGAVKFTDDGVIISEFLRHIDLNSLNEYTRLRPDYDTIVWWMSQDEEARRLVFYNESVEYIKLSDALSQFNEWLIEMHGDDDYVEYTKYRYWTHATFDPPVLRTNCEACGIDHIIPHWRGRDLRTLEHFFKTRNEDDRKGVFHNALDDAKTQAHWVSLGIAKFNKMENDAYKYLDLLK